MEMNWSLSELNKLTLAVQGLKDDPEGCACVVTKLMSGSTQAT